MTMLRYLVCIFVWGPSQKLYSHAATLCQWALFRNNFLILKNDSEEYNVETKFAGLMTESVGKRLWKVESDLTHDKMFSMWGFIHFIE
jgi:hypothetical protein